MAVTVSGTTITFNDGSTQTTSVLNATAAASAGVVGSYAFLDNASGSTKTTNVTLAGSSLRYSPAWGDSNSGVAPSGTWRCMGYATAGGAPDRTTLWLRIS